jgi:Ribbon-helix-helix protein, copG family
MDTMPQAEYDPVVSIRMPSELANKLTKIAEERGIPRAILIRQMLRWASGEHVKGFHPIREDSLRQEDFHPVE